MNNRLSVIIIAVVIFLTVSFTPIVPLMLQHYGISDIFIIRTVIGLLTLAAGWMFAGAIINSEKEREGTVHFRLILLIVGVAIVLLAWYTDLSKWVSDFTGTTKYLQETNPVLIDVGHRIWVSLLTLIGVILIKFGVYWQEEVEMVESKKGKKEKNKKGRSQVLDQIDDYGEK